MRYYISPMDRWMDGWFDHSVNSHDQNGIPKKQILEYLWNFEVCNHLNFKAHKNPSLSSQKQCNQDFRHLQSKRRGAGREMVTACRKLELKSFRTEATLQYFFFFASSTDGKIIIFGGTEILACNKLPLPALHNPIPCGWICTIRLKNLWWEHSYYQCILRVRSSP